LTKKWVTPINQATYYAYDGAGSLRRSVDPTAGTTYFEYGSHGLVTKIIPPAAAGQPWSFGYDAVLNRTRIVRGDTGKASYFTWDGMEQLEERDAVGTLIARFVHGRPIVPGVGSVVEVQRASAPLGSQFVHADHQGSVHKVTDAMGRVQVSYTTDAFGRQIAPATGLTPTMANDVIFHGNWMTVMVGGKRLCLSPSRVYDPELGQFLQRDPLPMAVGITRSLLDGKITGLFSETIFLGIIEHVIQIPSVQAGLLYSGRTQVIKKRDGLFVFNADGLNGPSMYASFFTPNKQDGTGMLSCCGADITDEYDKLLNSLQDAYLRLSFWARQLAFAAAPANADVWEFNADSVADDFAGIFANTPSGQECTKTATYKGNCYLQEELNYILVGRIADIIAMSNPGEIFALLWQLGNGSSSAVSETKVDLYKYGALGWSVPPAKAVGPHAKCEASKNKWTRSLHSRWP
jgi:YD repeat-containing protein